MKQSKKPNLPFF